MSEQTTTMMPDNACNKTDMCYIHTHTHGMQDRENIRKLKLQKKQENMKTKMSHWDKNNVAAKG